MCANHGPRVLHSFAKWSLSDTQADLRFYLSTQPELFDKLLIALHFAHGISDRRDAQVCLPKDNGPSIYFAIIKLYAARAKDKALGGSSSSYESSWSPCSSMSLRVEAQPLFEAVISNATRLGYSSEEISDIDAVSGIGEKFLLGNGECCERPGEPASAAPSDGNVTTKKMRVDWSKIPENMHPTAKQMLSRHYPLIVRLNAVKGAGPHADDDALCRTQRLCGPRCATRSCRCRAPRQTPCATT